jgi:glycosyltransferase involved in cell wall biosynthesis
MTSAPSPRPYRVKAFGFRGMWGQIYRVEEGFRRIGCQVASEGEAFDFIYSNELPQDREAVRCKEATGKPLIRHVHDLSAYEGTPFEKDAAALRTHRDAVLGTADRVTVNTAFVAGQLARYWDFHQSIVTAQPMQIDPDLDGYRTRKRRNLAIVVGRLNDPLKNTKLVLRALSQLRAPPDLAMVWVGKSKKVPRSTFRCFKIEHHREIPAPALAALMKEARMVLAPSLFEGLGLPPIEGLALGTPCIVSDIPVKREVFAGVPVSFHAPNDAADLARAIKFLLDHEENGWRMVDGFAPKIELYRPETIAAKICTIYEELRGG